MFNQYAQITIVVGGGVAHSAVVSQCLHVQVVAQTAKAVKVQADNGDAIWLPKKALSLSVSWSGEDRLYTLARWMRRKLDGYQWHFINRHSSFGGQTSA